MIRRAALLALAFVVMQTTGCGLLEIALVPIKLLFSILGGIAGLVGLADVTPTRDPPPLVQNVADGQWLVTGLSPDAPCKIVCSAPGCAPRTYSWPDDFAGRGGDVAVRLDPAK